MDLRQTNSTLAQQEITQRIPFDGRIKRSRVLTRDVAGSYGGKTPEGGFARCVYATVSWSAFFFFYGMYSPSTVCSNFTPVFFEWKLALQRVVVWMSGSLLLEKLQHQGVFFRLHE